VAGVGLSAGVLSSSVYSTIVIMVAATTIITPIWLKMDYRKDLSKQIDNTKKESTKNDKKENSGDNN